MSARRFLTLPILLLAYSAAGQTQTTFTISTVAGDGAAGYSGDGGLATSAALNAPFGVAVDAAGNLYIADTSNNRIRKVAANGTITTVAGTGLAGFGGDNGPATQAFLNAPSRISFDRAGNLYIPDSYNNRVRKVDTSGIITTVAGSLLLDDRSVESYPIGTFSWQNGLCHSSRSDPGAALGATSVQCTDTVRPDVLLLPTLS